MATDISPLVGGSLLVVFMLGAALGYWAGTRDYREQVRREAVTAGVGFYVVNPTTGETRFVFRSANPEVPSGD